MKYFVITTILFSIITLSAIAELTPSDLEKIQKIVETSETRIKEYVNIKVEALEKNMNTKFDSVNERFDGVDKRFGEVGGKINILTAIVCALIGLIGVVIALPVWRSRKDENALKEQIDTLTQKVEALENGRIQAP